MLIPLASYLKKVYLSKFIQDKVVFFQWTENVLISRKMHLFLHYFMQCKYLDFLHFEPECKVKIPLVFEKGCGVLHRAVRRRESFRGECLHRCRGWSVTRMSEPFEVLLSTPCVFTSVTFARWPWGTACRWNVR